MYNETVEKLEEFTDYVEFERLCSDILVRQGYQNLDPHGVEGADGGKDALINNEEEEIVCQYSAAKGWKSKLHKEFEKVEKNNIPCSKFIFVTNRTIGGKTKSKEAEFAQEEYGWTLELYDGERLRALLDNKYQDLREKYLGISSIGTRYYKKFGVTDEDIENMSDFISQQGGIQYQIPFVGRDEVDLDDIDKQSLILGREGSGKTRTLIEIATVLINEKENISEVIVPSDALRRVDQTSELTDERFENDVLLLWDDIHKLCRSGEKEVFQDAIRNLKWKLEQEGKSLYIISTARIQEINNFPDYGRGGKTVWNEFTEIELYPLARNKISEISRYYIDDFNLEVEEEVLESFVETAYNNDPTPYYIESFLASVTDRITKKDIHRLPANILEFWEKEYEYLRDEHEDAGYILWSIKLLSDVGVPYPVSVVRGIYNSVFNRDKSDFSRKGVKTLTDKRWIYEAKAIWEETEVDVFAIHDINLEAIDENSADIVDEFSSFLLNELEHYFPDNIQWYIPRIHNTVGWFFLWGMFDANQSHAEKHFKKAAELAPNEPKIRNSYALFLHKEGRNEEAKKEYQEGIQNGDPWAIIHNNYANLLEDVGETNKAIEEYEKAIEINPYHGDSYYNYGTLLMEQGKTKDAIKNYERAIAVDPLNLDARTNLGALYDDVERYEKAEKQYQKALEIDENQTDTRYNYAINLLNQGRLKEARKEFEELIEITNNNPKMRFGYGLVLDELGNSGEALQSFKQACELDPTDPEKLTRTGIQLMELGKSEESKEYLKKALEEDPDSREAWVRYATLLAQSGNPQEGLQAFKTAEEKFPKDTELLGNYAYLLGQLGDKKEAEEKFKKAININKENAQVYGLYANFLKHYGEISKSKENFKKSISINEDLAKVRMNYGILLCEEGEYEEAKSELNEALTKAQNKEVAKKVHNALASVFIRLNQKESAIEHLEMALEIDPTYETARINYAQLKGD